MSEPAPARPTIGLLTDTLQEGYNRAICESLFRAAEASDVNLLCFLGGALPPPGLPPGARRGRNWAFELVSPARVDGLIVLSGSVGHLLPLGEITAFLERFRPLPTVSVSIPVAGLPSLLVDGTAGIGALVDHLVLVHERRRIAFIRGPEQNAEALARLDAYRQALARHGIPWDERLVVPGGFHRASGRGAVERLLRGGRLGFDALMGANDYAALDAMQELQRRGVSVPDEVALTGFDDLPEAASAIPALTTVRQPLAELGELSLRTLLDLLAGRAAGVTSVAARPVLRRSCGCAGAATVRPQSPAPARGAQPATVRGLVHHLRERFPELAHWTGDAGWAGVLCGALVGELGGAKEPGAFLGVLERQVAAALARGGEADRWTELVTAVSGYLSDSPSIATLTRLCDRALTAVALLSAQAELSRRLRADEEYSILWQTFDLDGDDLERSLRGRLPLLGIDTFLACRDDVTRRTAAVTFVHDPAGVLELAPTRGPFPSTELLPGHLTTRRRWSLVVLPLHYVNEPLGHALCSLGGSSLNTFETLGGRLGTAMKIADLGGAPGRGLLAAPEDP